MTHFKPIKLKNLSLPNNIVYSPLAGVSDLPFRQVVRKFTDSLIFTEMTKADAIARSDQGTFSMLSYTKNMHPIGGQICTAKKDVAREASKIIEDLGFDVLDLNCGCPVDKVTKDGSGSAMLKTPELIGEILYEMQKAVDIPVTVKIRAGWSEDNVNCKEVTKIAEQAGASAIFIHGRTRKQAYKGGANWEYIKHACDQPRSIKVFANGDICSRESAIAALEQTGADGVLISRVTMGGPFAACQLLDENFMPPHPLSLLEDHIEQIVMYTPPRKILSDIRRVSCWYLKDHKELNDLRKGINKAKELEEVFALIESVKSET